MDGPIYIGPGTSLETSLEVPALDFRFYRLLAETTLGVSQIFLTRRSSGIVDLQLEAEFSAARCWPRQLEASPVLLDIQIQRTSLPLFVQVHGESVIAELKFIAQAVLRVQEFRGMKGFEKLQTLCHSRPGAAVDGTAGDDGCGGGVEATTDLSSRLLVYLDAAELSSTVASLLTVVTMTIE